MPAGHYETVHRAETERSWFFSNNSVMWMLCTDKATVTTVYSTYCRHSKREVWWWITCVCLSPPLVSNDMLFPQTLWSSFLSGCGGCVEFMRWDASVRVHMWPVIFCGVHPNELCCYCWGQLRLTRERGGKILLPWRCNMMLNATGMLQVFCGSSLKTPDRKSWPSPSAVIKFSLFHFEMVAVLVLYLKQKNS